jgi:hypothetical protein
VADIQPRNRIRLRRQLCHYGRTAVEILGAGTTDLARCKVIVSTVMGKCDAQYQLSLTP